MGEQRPLNYRATIVQQLEQLAAIAAEREEGHRAARLGGAAHVIAQQIGYDLRTSDHPELPSVIKALLGDAFEAAWQAGQSLTPEEAMAETLNEATAGARQSP
jgi:hypothetical protein